MNSNMREWSNRATHHGNFNRGDDKGSLHSKTYQRHRITNNTGVKPENWSKRNAPDYRFPNERDISLPISMMKKDENGKPIVKRIVKQYTRDDILPILTRSEIVTLAQQEYFVVTIERARKIGIRSSLLANHQYSVSLYFHEDTGFLTVQA